MTIPIRPCSCSNTEFRPILLNKMQKATWLGLRAQFTIEMQSSCDVWASWGSASWRGELAPPLCRSLLHNLPPLGLLKSADSPVLYSPQACRDTNNYSLGIESRASYMCSITELQPYSAGPILIGQQPPSKSQSAWAPACHGLGEQPHFKLPSSLELKTCLGNAISFLITTMVRILPWDWGGTILHLHRGGR